jgi:hypothetical protein
VPPDFKEASEKPFVATIWALEQQFHTTARGFRWKVVVFTGTL